MSQIIAICGARHSGKSEVAKMLVEHHGYTRLRFADGLKAMLRSIGLTEAQVDGDEKNEPLPLLGGKTARHAMVTLGTDWGRDLIDEAMWARVLEQQVLTHLIREKNSRIVIDDLRMPNELALVQRYRATVVRVHRTKVEPTLSRRDRLALLLGMDWLSTTHRSELHWQSFAVDREIHNEHSLEYLRRAASSLAYETGQAAIQTQLEGVE